MDKGKAVAVEETYVALKTLRPGARSAIRAMVCRKWDVTNFSGKYRSTEYILSDDEGNAIQCSARSNISHCFISKLEEGSVYSFKDFSVVHNKEKYRIRHTDACVVELEGYTIVKKLDCASAAFDRFPFQLTSLDEIRLNDSLYLIDVMGYVMDVGSVRTTPMGSELIEFYLMNDKGTRIRVTLWGALCNEFLNRPGHQELCYIIILPSMNIKDYGGEIYLSATSATTLFDSLDIPQIADFHAQMIKDSTPAPFCSPPQPVVRRVTVAELVRIGREQKEARMQTIALQCKVLITTIRTKDSWFYTACGNGNCRKRVGRVSNGFWCATCKKSCDFPRTSFRIHVDVEDETGSVVLTLFDAAAELLLKHKASMYVEETMNALEPTVIPQDLLNLVNTSHVFEMKTHTYFDKMYVSFTVNKVVEANIHVETPPTGTKRPREEDDSTTEAAENKLLCSDTVNTHDTDNQISPAHEAGDGGELELDPSS